MEGFLFIQLPEHFPHFPRRRGNPFFLSRTPMTTRPIQVVVHAKNTQMTFCTSFSLLAICVFQEMADVFIYVTRLADLCGADLCAVLQDDPLSRSHR